MKSIQARLEALEALAVQKPLMVLCRLPSGQLKETTAADCVDRKAEFIRVTRGNRLKDLDTLLKAVFDEAGADYESGKH